MEILKCPKGCCTIKQKPYISTKEPYEKVRRRRHKAGAFIYDPNTEKVLLVQSRGHLWGAPKGTINHNESERDCAVREVKEETGLNITVETFPKAVRIRNRAIYYYIEMNECEVEVQDIEGNDANGITWIKTSCLEDCINNGNITLSQHCRIVCSEFIGQFFPYSNFIKIK